MSGSTPESPKVTNLSDALSFMRIQRRGIASRVQMNSCPGSFSLVSYGSPKAFFNSQTLLSDQQSSFVMASHLTERKNSYVKCNTKPTT